MKESRHKKLEWMVQEVISEIIFEEVSEIEENFGILTVTGVKVSQDLSYLDVYVSCFKDRENLPKAIAEHNHEIQHKLNKKLSLYKLPRVRFRYDDSGEKAGNITHLLNEIKKEKK